MHDTIPSVRFEAAMGAVRPLLAGTYYNCLLTAFNQASNDGSLDLVKFQQALADCLGPGKDRVVIGNALVAGILLILGTMVL